MENHTFERRLKPRPAHEPAPQTAMPHERDELPDPSGNQPRELMQQAAEDVKQGLVDTDLHGIRGVEQGVTPKRPSGQARPRGAGKAR